MEVAKTNIRINNTKTKHDNVIWSMDKCYKILQVLFAEKDWTTQFTISEQVLEITVKGTKDKNRDIF